MKNKRRLLTKLIPALAIAAIAAVFGIVLWVSENHSEPAKTESQNEATDLPDKKNTEEQTEKAASDAENQAASADKEVSSETEKTSSSEKSDKDLSDDESAAASDPESSESEEAENETSESDEAECEASENETSESEEASQAESEFEEPTFPEISADDNGIIYINGIACKPRSNIHTYLMAGVFDGLNDTLVLLVTDQNARTYTMVPISRNTMMNLHNVDEDGSDLGYSFAQIDFAYSAGGSAGLLEAVSTLFGGQEIERYLVMSMENVRTLNDMVGGVTVTLTEDFSDKDPSMVSGATLTLTGQQAEYFVRGRMTVGDGSNDSRMQRQNQYMEAFKQAAYNRSLTDGSILDSLFNYIQSSAVTNMNGNDYSRLVNALLSYTSCGFRSITGSYGEMFEWEAFYPDEGSLTDLIIELFYTRI